MAAAAPEFTFTTSVLSRADGSGQASIGYTTIVCGVYGPTEVKYKDELLDRATLEINYRRHNGVSNTEDKHVEKLIKETLEPLVVSKLHPRSLIQITLQMTQEDGSALATAFNSVSVALADAGIPLCDTFIAIPVAVMDDNADIVVVAPTRKQETDASSVHTFVLNRRGDVVFGAQSEGCFSEFDLTVAHQTAIKALPDVAKVLCDVVAQSITPNVASAFASLKPQKKKVSGN